MKANKGITVVFAEKTLKPVSLTVYIVSAKKISGSELWIFFLNCRK